MAKKLGCASCGGTKKMAKGGSNINKLNNPRGYAKSQTGGSNIGSMIYGVPNAGMTAPNRNSVTETMKNGGSSRAVQASCKNGTVRGEDGRCVNARPIQFAKGGSAKSFPDLNKDGKVTKADILKGRGVIKKTGGATKMAKGGVAHPGFKAVQAGIAAKQGVSKEAAGAILASSTRKASAKAKRNNPRLKKVKG